MEFIVQIDPAPFKTKPTSKDVATIKPRLASQQPISCDIRYLEQAVLNGQTFSPGILQGGAKAENWISQQVFAIDIDNEKKGLPKGSPKQISDTPLNISEVLKRCNEWDTTPSLIYETFSSTPEWQKFRIIFICSEIITDAELRDNIQRGLQDIFPECDSGCINRDRMFFGGVKTLYVDYTATFVHGNISTLGAATVQQKDFENFAISKYKSNDTALDELKRSYDLLGLIRQSGSYEKRTGRLICFNPCPICGHNSDFFFYPETNSFKCFGANGNVGGTVIDYIMHTQKIDATEAVKYFKYTLCGINKKEETEKKRKEECERKQKEKELKEQLKQAEKALKEQLKQAEREAKEVEKETEKKARQEANRKIKEEKLRLEEELEQQKRSAVEKRKEIMLNKYNKNPVSPAVPSMDELPPYIYEKENSRTGEITFHVSCPLLAKYIRQHSYYIFVQDNAKGCTNRYWYDNGYYKLINEDAMKGYIKQYITVFDETLLKMSDIHETYRNLITDLTFVSASNLNADENIINFQNGILNLDTMKLEPHSPDVFSTIQIPCNWNMNPPPAPVFKRFMERLVNSKEERSLLLQYMGVCISNVNGHRMKKALFMIGKGDTGKSQLKSLTEKLLGERNFTSIDLEGLEGRFGTSSLHNKRLAGSSDMSYINVKELKVFKKVTGGDSLFAEYKNENSFEFVYKGLLWFCANQLPKFSGDRGDWVYERIMVIKCDNVIPEHERDKKLLEKMYAERETIVYLAINELKKIIDNGYVFSIPNDCGLNIDEYKISNSIVHQFYDECCVMRTENKLDGCTTKKMYDVFNAWCKDNSSNGYRPSKIEFKREISEILKIPIDQIIKRSNSNTFFIFTLNLETKRDYVREYGFDNIVSEP